jgi:predicted lipoprotein
MKNALVAIALILLPHSGAAQSQSGVTRDVVTAHVLPRLADLAASSQTLADASIQDCTSDTLRIHFTDAFDAWVAVSHMRFGPTEVDNRAFALAFWPDSRGATPKALAGLIINEDTIAQSTATYADMSISARGFYALEFLLYDVKISAIGNAAYRCQLIQTVAADIRRMTAAIHDEWQGSYATQLLKPSASGVYRSEAEATQELFKALLTGLQFTSETRMGRPLGTFDQPWPTRAEAWRSARSTRHVAVSLTTLDDLALRLAEGNLLLQSKLSGSFNRAHDQLLALKDSTFAGVALPSSRFKIEIVQKSIEAIRTIARDELGPHLGVAAGFNALDGD